VVYSLKLLLRTWKRILGNDKVLLQQLDPETVREVQLRCPRHCQQDSDTVARLMRKNQIFPFIQDDAQRREIVTRMDDITYLIPSLFTVQENCRYLQPCAKVVRQLFISEDKKRLTTTIREAAAEAFSGVNQTRGNVLLQISETNWKPFQGDDQLEFGIQQLYAFAMREVFEMIEERPLKEFGEPNPVLSLSRLNKKWHLFGELAYSLGFVSPKITELKELDGDEEDARAYLQGTTRPGRIEYDREDFEENVATIRLFLQSLKKLPTSKKPKLLVDGPGESMQRRCGPHWANAYEYDREFSFIKLLSEPVQGRGRSISSFFVRKSVFSSFFEAKQAEDIEMISVITRPSSPKSASECTVDTGVSCDKVTTENRNPKKRSRPQSRPDSPTGMRDEQNRTRSPKDATESSVSRYEAVRSTIRRRSRSRSPTGVQDKHFRDRSSNGPQAFTPIVHYQDGGWKEIGRYQTQDEIEKIARQYTERGLSIYTSDGRTILLEECFRQARSNRGKVWLAYERDHAKANFPDEL
jgi:hypothetical protein